MCIIASQWVYEKAPGDKAVTQAEIYKTKLCVWEGNNSPTLLRERIIFWRPHSKMDINMKKKRKDFTGWKENKVQHSGKKQMTQMFFSDLSSAARASPGFCMAISYLTQLNDGTAGSAESLLLKYPEHMKT